MKTKANANKIYEINLIDKNDPNNLRGHINLRNTILESGGI